MVGLGVRLESARSNWWPAGASFAADFVNRRFMRGGLAVPAAEAFSFNRSGGAWLDNGAGDLTMFADQQPRWTEQGLMLETARTRLSLAPVQLGASPWTNSSGATTDVLAAEGQFIAPCRIFSGGFDFSRRASASMTLTAGVPVHVKVRYRAGTSPTFGVYVRTNLANVQSVLSGAPGALTVLANAGGNWANIVNTTMTGGAFEVSADILPNTTQTDWQLGLSPRSSIAGEYVDVLGAMACDTTGATSWILGDAGAAVTRAADALTLQLPSFPATVSVTFFDGSTQVIAGQAGPAISISQLTRATVRQFTG